MSGFAKVLFILTIAIKLHGDQASPVYDEDSFAAILKRLPSNMLFVSDTREPQRSGPQQDRTNHSNYDSDEDSVKDIRERLKTSPLWPSNSEIPRSSRYLLREFDHICGLEASLGTSVVPHIANGESVTRHYPWIVAVYVWAANQYNFLCGGTLISKRHMISAAHCFNEPNEKLYKFVISNNLQSSDRITRMAKYIKKHEGYLTKKPNADIALVVFDREVPHNDRIRPICLWLEGRNDFSEVEDKKGLVVGWGYDQNSEIQVTFPNEVQLPLISHDNCILNDNRFGTVIGEKTFCAGYKTTTGTCKGDSGSGLIIRIGDRWALRGIVSVAIWPRKSNCLVQSYSAMPDMAKYSRWILQKVRNSSLT